METLSQNNGNKLNSVYLEKIVIDKSQFLVIHICRVVGNGFLLHPALPLTEDVPAGGGGHRPALDRGGGAGEGEGLGLKQKMSAGRLRINTSVNLTNSGTGWYIMLVI